MTFSESAHWLGMPASQMSKTDFMHALRYKLTELRYCYNTMTPEQARKVAEQMKEVPIPVMSGEQS